MRFEPGEWTARAASAKAMWDLLRTSVPPLKIWLDALDDEERERAKQAYTAVFPGGVLRHDYVLIPGTRR